MSIKSLTLPLCSLALAFCADLASMPQARSADLPTYKSPSAVPAKATRVFDWTGFYAGGFAGGSLGAASQGYSVSSTWVTANVPSLIPFIDGAGSQDLGLRGADLGLETGYDRRVAKNVVLGVSGDLSWSNITGGRTTSGTLPIVALPYSITQRLSADWLGSLRLRAGLTPLDDLLIYVTGGPAFGHFSYAASYWDNLVPPFAPGNETENVSLRGFRAGWTLGGGAEWALSRYWSLSGEYRHSEYGALTGTGVLPLQQPSSTAYIGHSSGSIHVDTLRIGVNYHFD
jgi:outer membrane immunogenic protein